MSGDTRVSRGSGHKALRARSLPLQADRDRGQGTAAPLDAALLQRNQAGSRGPVASLASGGDRKSLNIRTTAFTESPCRDTSNYSGFLPDIRFWIGLPGHADVSARTFERRRGARRVYYGCGSDAARNRAQIGHRPRQGRLYGHPGRVRYNTPLGYKAEIDESHPAGKVEAAVQGSPHSRPGRGAGTSAGGRTGLR